jgi:hypothetical protein
LAPGIYVTDLKIDEINDNVIKGQFTISNYEQYYLNDLNYVIKLFKGTTFEQLELIDVNASKEVFFAPPGKQEITKSFTYTYPENIISGDYTLRAQVITQRGSELGWKDKIISLTGADNFLDIDYSASKVLVNAKEYYTLEGVSISADQAAVGYLKVKNSGEQITVVPNIKIFKRQFNMPLHEEYQDSPITFAKGQTKEVKLEMPKIDVPESYLAEVKFLKDGKQVSGIQYFRWVVKGENAKILYVKTGKDYFQAGDNIDLIIEISGSADNSEVGNCNLDISVFNEDRNLINQTAKEIFMDYGLQTTNISIPVKTDLVSPIIEIKLAKDGKVLDERTINLPVFSEKAKQLEARIIKEKILGSCLFFSLIAIILVLIIGIPIYIKFKKK